MSNGVRLELSSLPQRHPATGDGLLYDYGRAAIHRLCVDPDPLPAECEEREVTIEHTPVGSTDATTVRGVIGWAGHLERDFCARASVTRNSVDVTEAAAIVVAALTISEFERGRIVSVSEVGSGGDYYVEVDWRQEPALLEIRGVLADETPSGSTTRSKVQEKRKQVKDGYVSVTAFHHTHSGTPYTVLCFVTQAATTPKPRRRGGRK